MRRRQFMGVLAGAVTAVSVPSPEPLSGRLGVRDAERLYRHTAPGDWSGSAPGRVHAHQRRKPPIRPSGVAHRAETGACSAPQHCMWPRGGGVRSLRPARHRSRRCLRLREHRRDVGAERGLGGVEDIHARDKALYLTWLASSYAQAREFEQAAATLDVAHGLAEGVVSARPVERFEKVARRLAHHRSLPQVGDVLGRIGV